MSLAESSEQRPYSAQPKETWNQAADELSTSRILTLDGEPVQVSTLWSDRTIVLAFIRQYGCLFCRQQVVELNERRPEIEAAGGTIVLIGCGEPAEARAFRDRLDLTLELYTDPGLGAFDAAGLKRGLMTALKRGSWRAGRAAWRSGFRQTKTAGNVWQQGGMFVVDSHARVYFEHVSEWAGDHPDLDLVVNALDDVPERLHTVREAT